MMLKYYMPPHGFEDSITFIDSVMIFENLWEEWLNTKLYLLPKGTPLLEKDYKDVFESLSEEKNQNLLREKRLLQKRRRYICNIIPVGR